MVVTTTIIQGKPQRELLDSDGKRGGQSISLLWCALSCSPQEFWPHLWGNAKGVLTYCGKEPTRSFSGDGRNTSAAALAEVAAIVWPAA